MKAFKMQAMKPMTAKELAAFEKKTEEFAARLDVKTAMEGATLEQMLQWMNKPTTFPVK